MTTAAFAAFSPTTPLGPHRITRREPGPTDVAITILYCGVCHSDLHTVRDEWDTPAYPCVPGHEIVGRVTRTGAAVTRFAPGDLAGVGCMVDSCRTCAPCRESLEQFCEVKTIFTYDSPDRHLGGVTYGGYSADIVVDQAFVLRMPESLDPAEAAPLLCAGITTYSALSHWKVGAGSRVGVVGLGGLGHMGVKIAHALGATVVVFTTTPEKEADARRFGASDVVLGSDQAGRARHTKQLDFILDTAGSPHDLNPYLALLARDGVMTLVGVPATPHPPVSATKLISGRHSLAGSIIGGIRETQEMLDFCAGHGITSEIELIPIQEINAAYDRMLTSDVRYRFVIDMASLA